MRIRKTSQYIEGGASISNVYGTSQSNGYSQNYINNLVNGTVLFNDDNGIMGADIPLSDSKNNYDYVKITYSISKEYYMTLEIPTITNYVSLFFPTNTSAPAISIRNARYTFGNNLLQFTNYSSIMYNGTNITQPANAIHVHKVVGYK